MTLLNFFKIWGRMTSFSVVSCRSSHRRRSTKNDVLGNFAKFTGKRQFQSPFFNKVGGLRPATLLKKTLALVFSCGFCEISKEHFFCRTPLDDCFCSWSHLSTCKFTYHVRCTYQTPYTLKL